MLGALDPAWMEPVPMVKVGPALEIEIQGSGTGSSPPPLRGSHPGRLGNTGSSSHLVLLLSCQTYAENQLVSAGSAGAVPGNVDCTQQQGDGQGASRRRVL